MDSGSANVSVIDSNYESSTLEYRIVNGQTTADRQADKHIRLNFYRVVSQSAS